MNPGEPRVVSRAYVLINQFAAPDKLLELGSLAMFQIRRDIGRTVVRLAAKTALMKVESARKKCILRNV